MKRLLLALMFLGPIPVWATDFTANLKTYALNAPTAFVRVELRGCSAGSLNYIPNVSGTGVFVGDDRGGINIFPDVNGLVTGVTIQDQSTIACAGLQGLASSVSPIYYHISVWRGSQSRPLDRVKLAEADYDIYGVSFSLNSATPKSSTPPEFFGGSASAFLGIQLDRSTPPSDGQGWFYNQASGKYVLQTGGSGGGGSTVNVNSLTISNPNFNNSSPLAETSFANCRFQQSGVNVSLECPQGTSGATFAAGNDARILNAVPNTRLLNSHPLSTDLTLTKTDIGLANADNTSDANKPVSTAQQTALDLKLGKPVSGCNNSTTDKLIYDATANGGKGGAVCATDQTTPGGTGVTSIQSLTASSITFDTATTTKIAAAFSTTSSTNIRVSLSLSSAWAKADIINTAVYNDQANAYSAGLQDFSGATVKLPIAPGAAPTTEGLIQVDSTSHTAEIGLNGINRQFITTGGDVNGSNQVTALHLSPAPSLAPVGQACRGIDASGNCTGAFVPGNGTVDNAAQYSFPYYFAAGSSNTIDAVAPPTANGFYQMAYNVTGSAAVQPDKYLVGLGGRAVSGILTSDTVLYSDNGTVVNHDVSASGAVTVTLPTATTLGNPNFAFVWCNHSAQSDTIQPTTWTIQANSSAAASTLSVPSGTCFRVKVDPNSSTRWLADGGSSGGGSMVYPGAGIPVSTGSAWGTSLSETDGQIIAGVSGAWTKTTALPNGITATTQTQADGSTKVATTNYVDTGLATKASSTASTTVNGVTCTLGSTCTVEGGTNTQTSNYTLVAGDNGKTVIMNCSTSCTVTLLGTPSAGFHGKIQSIGSSTATVSLNSLTYNGSSSVPVLLKFIPIEFVSNGTNYFGDLPPVAGTNITLTPTSSGLTIDSSGGGGSTGVGRGSGSIDFPSIADGACNDQTFTFTGVTTSDTVIPGWPSTLTAGLVGQMFVSASDTVKVRLCNSSGAAIDLGALTYKVTLAVYNLNGSSTINFSAIADGACASNTFTLTGVAAGDPVTAGWPSGLETGLQGTMLASATDTIQVRLCNFSGASLDPASATFKASVAK